MRRLLAAWRAFWAPLPEVEEPAPPEKPKPLPATTTPFVCVNCKKEQTESPFWVTMNVRTKEPVPVRYGPYCFWCWPGRLY